jgi:hypothetical protein
MIFFLYDEQWPKNPIVETIIGDKSEQPWKIAKAKDGMYFRFLGPDFLQPAYFECHNVKVNVTNCLFLAHKGMEAHMDMLNLIISQSTVEAWASICDLISYRLAQAPFMMKSEIYSEPTGVNPVNN